MLKTLRRPGAFAGLLVLTATAGIVGLPTPATASSGLGIETVSDPGRTDSLDKTTTVTCPKGKKVIDAGGSIEYTAGGKVVMDDVFPDPTMKFVNVTGLESDHITADWGVEADAVCAYPLPGQEWIKAQTVSNSSSPKTLTVACSHGKTVLGNGYAITGGSGEVWVDEAVPNGDETHAATQVSLVGVEGDPYDGDWDLEGFLICADPLPGQRVLRDSTSPSTHGDLAAMYCVDDDQAPTGATAEIHNGTGTVVLTEDLLLNGVSIADADENDSPDDDWYLTTYIFCVDA
jgi:hypothetical protein